MKHDFRAAMLRATTAVRNGDLGTATRMIQETLSVKTTAAPPPPPPQLPKDVEDAEVTGGFPGFLSRFAEAAPCPNTPSEPDGTMLARSHTGPHGRRDYRLHMPATQPKGLLVMLHGCKQNPEDFARGTRMNEIAGEAGLIVIWPEQPRSANMMSCWNWFEPQHQGVTGEPAILASMTREVARELGIDRDHTYVAGLSAGGAMAAILGEQYPDVFSGIGIHSGLAAGSAHDTVSAFAAMGGRGGTGRPALTSRGPRVILFHGDADQTVDVGNLRALTGAGQSEVRSGQSGGRRFRQSIYTGPDGAVRCEAWTIVGAGHAWSGGSTAGSFADRRGPDASKEMVRFFTG